MDLHLLNIFAGWNFTFWEEAMIAGVLLIPIALIMLIIGAIIKKRILVKIGFILLLLSMLNLFVFLPNF